MVGYKTKPQSLLAVWLILLIVLATAMPAGGTVALAAPSAADATAYEHSDAQEVPSAGEDLPTPDASEVVTPAASAAPRSLYMPRLGSARSALETFEISVIQLNQAEAQSGDKVEQSAPAQAGGEQIPPPPPGEEQYPAQPDLEVEAESAAVESLVESPDALDATVTIVEEDFEGTFPKGNWQVLDSDGTRNGEYFWDEDDAMAHSGSRSAWVANGGKNGLDPDKYNYPDNLQTWMIYGPFDLSDASRAQLSFSYWNLSEMHYDFLGWYASPNGKDFYGYRVSGNSTGWKPTTLDLGSVPVTGSLLGDSSVWIAFRFTSDGSKNQRGAFVDKIRVQKEEDGNCTDQFTVEYFNNRDLSGKPVFTGCEKAPINHNWGSSGPGYGIGSNDFSVRWTGTFDFSDDLYNFVATSDDGLRVWLDNSLIIDNWQEQGPTPHFSTRQMSAGRHTIRVEYFEQTGGALAQFRWLRSDTTLSNRQAFDTCNLPHPSEMQTWWDHGPYYEVGIYIGGNNRGCKTHNNEHLTASWVATVRDQGWNLIPTWVGPQAPCTTQNFYTMSSDPEIAYAEGRHEAGDAALAAEKLGLTTQDLGGTVIYYDMEPYPDNAGCREAVKSFMAGWASRLHELGNQAGAYGAACASYVTDWLQSPPYVLDHIWPAAWIHSKYNESASVWDVSCIDNSLWRNHQRIRQYAGDHNETWGNVTLFVDSNAVDGQVAGDNPRAGESASELGQAHEPLLPVQVTDMALLAEKQGWVIAEGRLLWTTDGGATWTDRTPGVQDLEVRAASFLDPTTGWIAGAGLPDAQSRSTLYLGMTQDGGLTWQLRPMHEFNPVEPSSTQGEVKLTFFDASNGYMQIKLASSSNFDIHTLLKTVDGGATWQEVKVPGNQPVDFADASTGWTVGTTTEAAVQVTVNGGASWQPAEAAPAAAALIANQEPFAEVAASVTGAATASFLDNGTGWVFVDRGLCSGSKSTESVSAGTAPFSCMKYTALLSTPDGGSTWIDITPLRD